MTAYIKDLSERAVRAFLGAAFGTIAVVVPVTDLSTARTAAAAAVAAGVSAVLSLLAGLYGEHRSASLDPSNRGSA